MRGSLIPLPLPRSSQGKAAISLTSRPPRFPSDALAAGLGDQAGFNALFGGKKRKRESGNVILPPAGQIRRRARKRPAAPRLRLGSPRAL